MISYTMVGTKDIKKAGKFFDKVLGFVGIKRRSPFLFRNGLLCLITYVVTFVNGMERVL